MNTRIPADLGKHKCSSLVVAAVLFGCALWWFNSADRRSCLTALDHLHEFVIGQNRSVPRKLVILPESILTKSQAEADQWLRDVLRDEISEDGIKELRRFAQFGPLSEIFPETATVWAKAAGYSPEECLAFRMERNGVTAEVVIVSGPDGFRISRCNNVKQMAQLSGL